MDKLLKYQTSIKKVLSTYKKQGAINPNAKEKLETQLLFDDTHNRYQVLRIGWEDIQHTFLVIFYFEIKNNKIWVQRNISDYDIIGDLEAEGIAKKDIVLAFHSPRMRPYTGYAVA